MNGTDDEHDVAHRFMDLWAAISASNAPQDTIDRLRDALDRKINVMARQRPSFIEGSFAVEAVAYETELTQVLQVTQRDLGSLFAIKTMPETRRDDAHLVQRLRREAEIGLALRHPCLHETSALLRLPDGRPGLLMPWAPVSLASLLRPDMRENKETEHFRVSTKGGNALDKDEIRILLHRVLRALEAMHAEGYVHGDVTASNILLSNGDIKKARLGDFGIALKTGEGHDDHGIKLAGSPEFSAPEQMAGAAAHPLHDIYAVGKLAQRLLEQTDEAGHEQLTKFVEFCTKKDALQRPQTATDALGFL